MLRRVWCKHSRGDKDGKVPEIFNWLIPPPVFLSLSLSLSLLCHNQSTVAEDSGNPGYAKQTCPFPSSSKKEKKNVWVRVLQTSRRASTQLHLHINKHTLMLKRCLRHFISPIRLVEGLTSLNSVHCTRQEIKSYIWNHCLPTKTKREKHNNGITAVWHCYNEKCN